MTRERAAESLADLEKAVARLSEIVDRTDRDDVVIEATVKRFEFTFELLWKALKHCLELQGVIVASPKQAFIQAFQMRWITDESLWLSMLVDRNLTVHMYHQGMVREVAGRIVGYAPAIHGLVGVLRQALEQHP